MKETDKLKNKALSALIYSFSGFITNSGIQFLLSIILARLLFPEDYGLLGMIMFFISISQLFVDSGMTTALIREKTPKQEDYSTVFYYNLTLSVVMYVIVFISANAISQFFSEPALVLIIRITGINLIISSFGLIQRTILIRNLDFGTQTRVDVIAAVLSGIIAVYMAYQGFGVWSLVIQLLSRQLIISAMFILHNRWIPLPAFNIESFKRLFGFGWKMLATGILATAYQNIYNVIIGKDYLTSQLGYYTKSLQTRDFAANSITTTLEKVTYPVFIQLQEDPQRFKSSFKKIIKISSFLTFPMMIGLAAVAHPLVKLLFGEPWLPMVPCFQILCIAGMTLPHRAINLNVLKVVGRSDLFLRIDIIKIIIGLVTICLVIVLDLGFYALLWTTFLNAKIAFITNTYYSKRYISYSTKEQTVDMLPTIAISIIMGLTVYIIGIILPFNTTINLLIQITFGIAIYVLLCKLSKNEELDEVYQLIKALILKLLHQKSAE